MVAEGQLTHTLNLKWKQNHILYAKDKKDVSWGKANENWTENIVGFTNMWNVLSGYVPSKSQLKSVIPWLTITYVTVSRSCSLCKSVAFPGALAARNRRGNLSKRHVINLSDSMDQRHPPNMKPTDCNNSLSPRAPQSQRSRQQTQPPRQKPNTFLTTNVHWDLDFDTSGLQP